MLGISIKVSKRIARERELLEKKEMKGSMKIKFDLGWVFSATLAVSSLIFAAIRLGVILDIQDTFNSSCYTSSYTLAKQVQEVTKGEDMTNIYYGQCKAEYSKPTVSLFMDLSVWSFQEAYPKLIKEVLSNG